MNRASATDSQSATANHATPSTDTVDSYQPDDADGGSCPLTIPQCRDAHNEPVQNGATAAKIVRGTIYMVRHRQRTRSHCRPLCRPRSSDGQIIASLENL